jgi:hypothetical protein
VLNTDSLTRRRPRFTSAMRARFTVDSVAEAEGLGKIGDLLQAQRIVNHVVFDLKIPIHFLEASAGPAEIVLHGVADSSAVIEKALEVARSMAPGKKVSSGISIVQDYKSYP